MRKLETFEWWPELLELKDTLSLRQLAQQFDVTPGAISAALRRTNTGRLPAAPGPKPSQRTSDALPPEPGERGPAPSAGATRRSESKPSAAASPPMRMGAVPSATSAAGWAGIVGGRNQAWQVVFRADGVETIRVIVAPNVVDAARAAAGAGTGDVVTLAWVGELL